METRNHITKRLLAWALALGSVACVAGYLAWSLLSDQFSAREAQLHPLALIRLILSQFGQVAPISEWNIPVRSLLVWIVWLFGIYGSGTLVGRYFLRDKHQSSSSEKAVLFFAIGFVCYSIVQLGFGLMGFARLPLILVYCAIGIAGFAGSQSRQAYLEFPRAALWRWQQLGFAGRALCILAIFAIGMLIVPALTPPTQSDGVRYHLAAPQEYLKAGAISYLPHNAYSNMPFLVEMHFLGALACKAPEAAQLMHLTLALFTVLAIYTLTGRLSFGPKLAPQKWFLALLPAMLYIGTPMSGILAGWPFTDHGISFFLLASVLAALACSESYSNWKRWALLGICTGGLLGVKYTMAPVAVVIAVLPFWLKKIEPNTVAEKRSTGPNGLMITFAIMALIGGIWYLKNLVFTGNPFYPLASSLFPGGEWSTANDIFLHTRAGVKGLGHGILDVPGSLWKSTTQWISFEAHNPGATIFLALVAIISGLITGGRHVFFNRRFALFLLTGLTYGIWFFTYQSNRLLLPALALGLCLSPVELLIDNKFARRLYGAAMVLAATCGFTWAIQWSWVSTGLTPPPLPYLLGAQDARSFRYKSLTYARAFDYLNKTVAPHEKVLLIGEHRIYSAQFSALWSDWFDTPVLATILRDNDLSSTTELLAWLRQHKTPWILINERELEPQLEHDFRPWFSAGEWQIFEDLRTITGPGIKIVTLPPGVRIIHLEDQP